MQAKLQEHTKLNRFHEAAAIEPIEGFMPLRCCHHPKTKKRVSLDILSIGSTASADDNGDTVDVETLPPSLRMSLNTNHFTADYYQDMFGDWRPLVTRVAEGSAKALQ
ncbi:hypothetical protein MMC24_001949 [Lignoscripta atroalba]|nr:hypothetical protein [Lignoscripta atroalba]